MCCDVSGSQTGNRCRGGETPLIVQLSNTDRTIHLDPEERERGREGERERGREGEGGRGRRGGERGEERERVCVRERVWLREGR